MQEVPRGGSSPFVEDFTDPAGTDARNEAILPLLLDVEGYITNLVRLVWTRHLNAPLRELIAKKHIKGDGQMKRLRQVVIDTLGESLKQELPNVTATEAETRTASNKRLREDGSTEDEGDAPAAKDKMTRQKRVPTKSVVQTSTIEELEAMEPNKVIKQQLAGMGLTLRNSKEALVKIIDGS